MQQRCSVRAILLQSAGAALRYSEGDLSACGGNCFRAEMMLATGLLILTQLLAFIPISTAPGTLGIKEGQSWQPSDRFEITLRGHLALMRLQPQKETDL